MSALLREAVILPPGTRTASVYAHVITREAWDALSPEDGWTERSWWVDEYGTRCAPGVPSLRLIESKQREDGTITITAIPPAAPSGKANL